MCNLGQRFGAILFCLLCVLSVKADGEIYFGIYQGTGTLSSYGTKKAETYDIALHLTDPTLVGMEVRGIRIPVNSNAKNAQEYKGWLSKELTLVDKVMTPDIVSVEVTPNGKWAEARFSEPYTIQEGGFYAGYSFKVTSLDASNDVDPNRTPVMTIATENPDGLLIHTSRTYQKWVGIANQGSPALVVLIGGDRVKANAAMLVAPDNLYTNIGKSISTTLTLVNHGTEAIKNIEYEIEVADKKETKQLTKSLSGGYYGRSTTFSATIPAVSEAGSYPAKFRITKVNGVENEDPLAETETPVVYLSELPLHKPLIEEYTGTWCQYCPKYLAGMEQLSDKNGDDYVGVAYHTLDEMSFTPSAYLPADPSGLPAAFIDRIAAFSPLDGQSDWEKRRNIIAPANISVVGEWINEEKTQIKATSTTTFIRDFSNSPYRIGYILIANDVHYAEWKQSNAFSGNAATGNSYFDYFVTAPYNIYDYHYNEVVLAQSAQYGAGLEESLPVNLQENIPYEYSYVFDISEHELFPYVTRTYTVDGVIYKETADVVDKNKLEVIAVLINTETGEVVNCNKGHVTNADGIIEVQSTKFKVQGYYDLSGRKVEKPRKGIYIRNGKKVIK